MGEGLKRAKKAARMTRMCPVRGCRRIRAKNSDVCRFHLSEWNEAVALLSRIERRYRGNE